MKKYVLGLGVFAMSFASAQNVIWNKVVKSHENTDRVLYKIDPTADKAEYLGEIEVQGFSDNDAEVFGMIYKKAKEIGANAFAYKPFESVDGKQAKFDPYNYRLSFYHLPQDAFPKEDGVLYIFAPPAQDQNISFNKETLKFKPRSFTKRKLKEGEIYTLSTRKLLGSSVKLAASANQPVQHFQLHAFQVQSNPYGEAGISLKSGDVVKLERSFAEFLTVIYREF
jgi:hypothetical protein